MIRLRHLLSLATLAAASGLVRAAECPTLEPLAEGVHLLRALESVPTPANGGRTGNSIVLIGATGVTVVDPGPALAAGRALACAIRRITPLPVATVVNSHPHPERVLANGAFPGAAIYATPATIDTMGRRCAHCRQRLEQLIGTGPMHGTEAVLPDQVVAGETAIRAGGRPLRLLPLGDARGHGDLAVFDELTGVLVAGDAGNQEGIPDLADRHLAGWIRALEMLSVRTDIRSVVPGYGAPFPVAGLAQPLAYLKTLARIAEREVAAGNAVPTPGALDELSPYGEDRRRHSLNLQRALREAESAWWSQPATGVLPAIPGDTR